MAAVVFMLCLVLATSVTAVPHGNDEKLKELAADLLAFTEGKGSQVFSEILLGTHVQNGKIIHDPEVLSHVQTFLQEVLFQLTTFKIQLTSNTENQKDRARSARDAQQSRRYAGLVLPPGSNLLNLDYNDILDILGDYTKGFISTVVPSMSDTINTDVVVAGLHSLVDTILGQIKEIKQI